MGVVLEVSMAKRPQRRKGENSTTAQGRIVERVVALMHEQPGVTVERNKYLPPVYGKGRKREIDILITGDLAGYPIQIAIECKDEAEAIGSPKIDAFVGKLKYLGLSSRQSIYVATHGYTTGAIERAEEAGIRLLTLRNLTDADLAHSITGAFQSTIYLLLQVMQMEVSNEVPPPYTGEALSFFDADGNLSAMFPDFIWQKWMTNEIPLTLGEHELNLPLPTNLRQMVNGNTVETFGLKTKVRVVGVVVTLEGQTKGYQLNNIVNETPERIFYDFSFSVPETSVPIITVASEEQLTTLLNRPGSFQVISSRIKLPRINSGPIYWPPSTRVVHLLHKRWQMFQNGEIPELQPLDWKEVEGTDLSTVWEPIWEGHPAGKQQEEASNT
jgi:Restriction endonuclease